MRLRNWLIGAPCVALMMVASFMNIYWIGSFVEDRIGRYIICSTEIHQTIPSPDGRLTAFVYEIDCGATTGFHRHVSFATSEWWFWLLPRPPFFSARGQYLSVRWRSERSLEIDVPDNETIYRQERAADGIAINYR